MFRQLWNWFVSIVIEYKSAKIGFSLTGGVLIVLGSIDYGPFSGGILVAGGVLTEVVIVYAVSTGIERTKKEIEYNRSEIEEAYSDMIQLSSDIEESKKDLQEIESNITGYQDELRTTKKDVENTKKKAVAAREEAEKLETRITNALSDMGI